MPKGGKIMVTVNSNGMYSILPDGKGNAKMDDLVGWVPTMSGHGKCARDRVNDILYECPDCAGLVYALLTYSTQKWASGQRKLLGIDRKVSMDLLQEADSAAGLMARIYRRTGIVPQTSGNLQDVIEDSDKILGCLEDALEWVKDSPKNGRNFGEVLRAVHFSTPDDRCPDVSKFLINEYYRDAVLCMHDRIGGRIDSLLSLAITPAYLCDGGITTDAYHDTLLCLKLYPDMIDRYARRGELEGLSDLSSQRDSDGLSLLSILEKAVRGVANHPGDGDTLYWILRLIMEGKNQNDMMETLGLGYRTLERQTDRAVNMLSFILWGYSTMQILNGVIFTPCTKGLGRYRTLYSGR